MIKITRNYSFQAFEAITTYAIDAASDREKTSILNELGMNKKMFFEELYVERPKERELEGYLRKGYGLIRVFGYPGTGKTSFVHKVLTKIEKENDAYIFSIDFKEIQGTEREELAEYSQMKEFMNKQIRKRIIDTLTREKISDYEVLKYFLNLLDHIVYEMSYNFVDIYRDLYNMYSLENRDTTFLQWIIDGLEDKKDYPIIMRVGNLIECLDIKDYLYYLANKNPKNEKLCIIFFDNVDSIVENEIRESFCEYIRKFQRIVIDSTKIVVAMRTNNVPKILSDQDAYILTPIELDYREFISDDILNERILELEEKKGYCNQRDIKYIENCVMYSARERFARKILKKRSDYLNKKIDEGITRIIHKSELEKIRNLCELLLGDDRIRVATSDMSNYDRRLMLVHINNFMEYITQKLNLNTDELGKDPEEIRFTLESYFYGWIIDNRSVFDTNIYNLVKDINTWWESDRKQLGCILEHLIIVLIANLTHKTRGLHSYISRTTVENVISRLSKLGYKRPLIKDTLYKMYKDNKEYKGIIETTKYFKVQKPGDIKEEDQIWLTPRASYLCDYATLKFLYMIASMRNQKIKIDDKVFDYDDKNPITCETICTNLKFLCKLAFMHFEGLKKIKDLLGREDWFTHYRQYFCLRTNIDPYKDGCGNLQFDNIIESHIRFLKHMQNIKAEESYSFITDDMIRQYKLLREKYSKCINKLKIGKISDIDESKFRECINFKAFELRNEKGSK